MTIAIQLAGGSLVFGAFLIVFFFAVVYGLYTARGSGITPRPYGGIYDGAPGAHGAGAVSGHDERERLHNWSRGAR